MGQFCALLSVVLAASLQTPAPAIPNAPSAKFQSCPVSIPKDLHFVNQTDKPISAIIFHEVRVNMVGEEEGPTPEQAKLMAAFNTSPNANSEQSYVAKKGGLQPGQEAHMSNNMAVYGRREKSVFRIYARAVKFEDGSVWQDDGSHSCKGKWELQAFTSR